MRVLLLLTALLTLPAYGNFGFTLPNFGGLPGFNLPGLGGSTGGGTVYVPKSLENNTKPQAAIVVLHGCLQSGADVLRASRFDQVADKEGFYVITPEQSFSANPVRCWNWFDVKNQKRSVNEVAAILNVVNKAIQDYPIDPERIIVAGFSAGAAMANVLAACHADMFSGVLSMAGVKFAGATNPMDAFNVMRSGSNITAETSARAAHQCLLTGDDYPTSLPKMMFVAGTIDGIVAPINSTQLVQANMKFYDLLDDSTLNDSILITGVKSNYAGKDGKRAYTKIDFETNGKALMKLITVESMGHAWSGGTANMQYSDPKGPAITEIAVDFFDLKSK